MAAACLFTMDLSDSGIAERNATVKVSLTVYTDDNAILIHLRNISE